MKRIWQLIGILLLLAIITGLGLSAFTPRHQLLSTIGPAFRVIKINNLRVTNRQARFQLHLRATSPYLPIEINKLHYQFKLQNQAICQGQQTITAKPRGKAQDIILSVQVPYQPALPLLQQQIVDQVPVNASFQMNCRVPLAGRQNINRQQNLTLEIPALPAPEITDLQTKELGFSHIRLVFSLKINNPNKFAYYIRQFSFNAQFPNYQAVATTVPGENLIKANQVTFLKIPATKALSNPEYASVFGARDPIRYNLKTTLLLEPINVAIDPIFFQSTSSGLLNISPKI